VIRRLLVDEDARPPTGQREPFDDAGLHGRYAFFGVQAIPSISGVKPAGTVPFVA
jgi:hypothetical protein